MANSSSPFDRLEESAAKRPRSAGEAIFARPSESGSESRILVPGAYFSHQQHEEIVAQYRIALAELTFNSKPIITNLSIIAGENLHAAEAIVATICAYIVEVPIEQKLPSLYLLDSIVKNVGGDYIKYFAVKLPEVFCKAYRQVDSSTHSGMRHLFGTWKGVFPPQSLQVIEDELGFLPVGSGSSAASTISPGSQFPGPPHRIHVNPKYLEAREQLQQSSMANVIASNYSGTFLSSNDEVERKDRAALTSSRRSLADPRLKIHNIQCPQRESFHEENISMTQWNYDYCSGLPKHVGLEIGRAVERNLEQSSVKHEDGAMTRSCSGLSWNWVKSAKEEFIRDDISRSSYRSTLNNSWVPTNREALGHEHFRLKPRTTRDSHSGIDKEASPYSWFTEHRDEGPFGWTESPSALEPHSSDVFIRSSSNRIMPGLLGNQQHSLDQTHLSSQCLPHQESRKSQLSGPLKIRLHNRVSGDPRMIGRSSSDCGNLSAKEVTEQSDTSRLLASILQSRILAENSNTDSVSSLLSSFASKGLISASKMDLPISVSQEILNQLLNSNTSILTSGSASASSILTSLAVPDLDELSKPAYKSSGGLSQSVRGDVKALIGFEFKPDVIRQLHPCVISELLNGIPHWCSICGLKFKYQTQLQRHLDCHELRIDSSNKVSRRWYPNSTDWISGKAGLSSFCGPTTVLETCSNMMERNEVMVPADESQCVCVLCGEIFEDVYSHERDKWMFKVASYMAISMSNDESETSCQGSQILIVHSSCKLKSQVQDFN